MEAWIQGQKATATVIKPVTVNLTMQHVVKRPRRMTRYEDLVFMARNSDCPPPCSSIDEYRKGWKEVACLDQKGWVALKKCWICYLTRNPGA